MENLAYLYLADAYGTPANDPLVHPCIARSSSVGDQKARTVTTNAIAQWFQGLNWRRLSSATYIRFVSLGVMLSVLSLTSHAWALSRGDRGLGVSNLQQNLRSLGCFNGSITGVFDQTTEAGVRRCQLALGLPGNGVADLTTEQVFQQRLGQVRSQLLIPNRTEPRLARGDRGDQVTFVQQILNARGYFNGPVTGFYGELTEAAVRSFQAANRLPTSGEIDATTYQLLQQSPPASQAASFSVPSQGFNTVAVSQGLKRGDRGFQVRELQKRLIVSGYSNVVLDGIYGYETEAAVKQFQIGYGFVPDGIADANTQNILNQKLYVVVVPKRNNTILTQVRQIFPTAFEAPSRLGTYVHVGSYPNYDIAKTRANTLRQSGIIDARVAYF
jgi:peptidoglycan hydrolase-like protein with peptidoglycan-binding domain